MGRKSTIRLYMFTLILYKSLSIKGVLSLLLPPSGAYRNASCLTQGVASLRSLALGWELIAPSGRADVAGGDRGICVGRGGGCRVNRRSTKTPKGI